MDKTTQTFLIIFTAVTAVSVLIQASVILAMFIGARKAFRKFNAFMEDLRIHALPVVVSSREMIQEFAPKLKTITANLVETTENLRYKADHISRAVENVVDRTHAQAARVDGMVSGALDHVESAAGVVQQGLTTPVRQVQGILNGLRAGLDVMRHRTPTNHRVTDQDLFV